MTDPELRGEGVCKRFGRNSVLEKLDFTFSGSGLYGIAGKNGTGKSTLCRLIARVLAPSKGIIEFTSAGSALSADEMKNVSGFAAPYVELYGEFSALENLNFLSKIRGLEHDAEYASALLHQFGIFNKRNEPVRAYSTGMKHKLVLIAAFLLKPALLILDEPFSNLDSSGCGTLSELISGYLNKSIIVLASNRTEELAGCSKIINL